MKKQIAIRVSNKREFDALMQHYESKGWNPSLATATNYKIDLGLMYTNGFKIIAYHHEFMGWRDEQYSSADTIIDFSTFAQIAGIEVKDEIEVSLGAVKALVDKKGNVHFTSVIGMLYGYELEAIYTAYKQLK